MNPEQFISTGDRLATTTIQTIGRVLIVTIIALSCCHIANLVTTRGLSLEIITLDGMADDPGPSNPFTQDSAD